MLHLGRKRCRFWAGGTTAAERSAGVEVGGGVTYETEMRTSDSRRVPQGRPACLFVRQRVDRPEGEYAYAAVV